MSKRKSSRARQKFPKVAPDGTYPPKSPKHIILIICSCGLGRWCKPQDAWQVKRCEECQKKKKRKNLEKVLPKLKSKVIKRKRRFVYYVDKFTWLTKKEREQARKDVRREMKQKGISLPIWPQ